jgi:hypothetical protein
MMGVLKDSGSELASELVDVLNWLLPVLPG